MRLRLRIATALALLLALCAPSPAHASGAAVVRDCADGALDHTYSQKDYADALAHIPADVDEYTNCRDLIKHAQLAGAGGGDGSGGAGGGATGGGFGGGGADDGTGVTDQGGDPLAGATPQERASYEHAVAAAAAAPAPVKLDGRPITAGDIGGATAHALSDLPTSLLVLLAILAAGAVAAGGVGTRRLVLRRRAI